MRSFALSRALAANYPRVFREVVRLIGEKAAYELVGQYGGTSLYIPSTPKPDHSLCQLLGQEAARQLAAEFGGLVVEIPRAVALQAVQRNALILADRAAGISQRQLALKYHLTERTIRKIAGSTRTTCSNTTKKGK